MKKLLVIALLCVCALSAHAIENAKCYLQHDGNVTTFESSAIAEAIEAAVKGDVLYLGEGQYPSFTLDKEITVRGAGADKTKIIGDVTISIPGTPTLEKEILVGLYINSSIYLNKAMNAVTIKQCSFSSIQFSANNDNILINRCNIRSYQSVNNYIKGLTIVNSKINQIYAREYTDSNVSTYLNCNISSMFNWGTSFIKGTFINCIVKSFEDTNSFGNCIFSNTLFGFDINLASTSYKQECYTDSKFTLDNLDCSYDTNALTSKGYLGNDGTVVGIYGGSNPYTLELNVPRITSSKIALDRENKVLNVNLKVTSK